SLERFLEVSRQLRLRFLCNRSNLECDRVAYLCAGCFTQRFADLQPVAELPVRFERSLKWVPVDRPFYGRPTAPRQLLARGLRQHQKRPRVLFTRLHWAQ